MTLLKRSDQRKHKRTYFYMRMFNLFVEYQSTSASAITSSVHNINLMTSHLHICVYRILYGVDESTIATHRFLSPISSHHQTQQSFLYFYTEITAKFHINKHNKEKTETKRKKRTKLFQSDCDTIKCKHSDCKMGNIVVIGSYFSTERVHCTNLNTMLTHSTKRTFTFSLASSRGNMIKSVERDYCRTQNISTGARRTVYADVVTTLTDNTTTIYNKLI